MKHRERPKSVKPAGDQRATPQDWVLAGLSLLVREGIDAVRVEPLAGRLDVTKGSFYWHFKDRAALHAAMLEAWRATATYEIIARVDAGDAPPRERLQRLVELTALNPKAARLETAIRSWARNDTSVAKVVAAIDEERVAYVAELLREIGFDAKAASLRARIMYLAVIGSFFAANANRLQAGPEFWDEITQLIG